MHNTYLLWTHGDPLQRTQQFLYDMWNQANLNFVLVTLDSEYHPLPTPSVVDDAGQFAYADPFIPFLSPETIPLIAELASSPEPPRFAAVIRPCEARSLRHLVDSNHIRLGDTLLVASECIGAFSPDDYAWRLARAGSPRELSEQVLRNARQGGISLDRFRNACQFCQGLIDSQADLTIHVYGLPIKEFLLISAGSDEIAARLHLDKITDSTPRPHLLEQHQRVVGLSRSRRSNCEERSLADLPPHLFADLQHLMAHLANCAPCRSCLEVCPNYFDDWIPSLEPAVLPLVEQWMEACACCGLCEDSCPNHLPLMALFKRVYQGLEHSPSPI